MKLVQLKIQDAVHLCHSWSKISRRKFTVCGTVSEIKLKKSQVLVKWRKIEQYREARDSFSPSVLFRNLSFCNCQSHCHPSRNRAWCWDDLAWHGQVDYLVHWQEQPTGESRFLPFIQGTWEEKNSISSCLVSKSQSKLSQNIVSVCVWSILK
jgi:hypothetical protein